MCAQDISVVRRPEKLLSDDKRVIARYLDFHDPQKVSRIASRVLNLDAEGISSLLSQVMRLFASRHGNLEEILQDNYEQAAQHFQAPGELTRQQKLLIGSYFTQEYSIEAAALFNPSIVRHPDQSSMPEGSVRFLMSLRATGEGHVSSIVFRRGIIDASGRITFDPPSARARTAKPLRQMSFHKDYYAAKLSEMLIEEETVTTLLRDLSDPFSVQQLQIAIRRFRSTTGPRPSPKEQANRLIWPARANYEIRFPSGTPPAEMVVFPATEYERQGMEDLRLVRFLDEGGAVHYYGTYTALDGRRTYPMLLETSDFESFRFRPLTGRYAKNKGMALFPRKVNDSYLMLSRHDGQNLFLLRSESPYKWGESRKLQSPREPWELSLIGNCGSPIETQAGWIVLIHGVGPLRRYCIGASLLDLKNPSRVIGRLREPLLVPTTEEREGYVPNVVYSCGSMIHNDRLIIPYSISDCRTAFATVTVTDLLARLLDCGP